MKKISLIILIMSLLGAIEYNDDDTTKEVGAIRKGVSDTLKAVVARTFMENTNTTTSKPDGFQSWGAWIIDTSGLDTNIWKIAGNGIEPIDRFSNEKCGVIVWLDNSNGTLHFDPNKIDGKSPICKELKESYDSSSKRTIQVLPAK